MTVVCALTLTLCIAAVSPLGAQVRDTIPRPVRPPVQLPPPPPPPPSPRDSTLSPGLRIRLGADSTQLPTLRLPTILSRADRDSYRRALAEIEAARATAFQQNMRAILESVWGQVATSTFATSTQAPAYPGDLPPKPKPVAARASDIINQYSDIALQLNGRLEVRAEKNQSASCGGAVANPVINCRNAFEPLLDFQFNARSGGIVAERVHVNLDYDTQREFDASNNISIYYEGKGNEVIQRIEAGNVSFQPPNSRFITAGIPSGNYGVQAIAKLGSMRLKTIAAQQKGNIVRGRVFTVGDRTLQAVDRKIEDYQFEPRRFFFTVPPRLLSGYPNIDILDSRRMSLLAASLPDTLRPAKIFLYRLLIGGQPPNPAGPQFRIIGDPRSKRGQVYEYLHEGVDYYADPSLLWIALVRPLSLNNERLVIAYRVRIHGRDTVFTSTGGTPDLEYSPARDQVANLLWDPQIKPTDANFDREIRSIYRLGGSDIRRQSVTLKVVTGSGADQEKPETPRLGANGQFAETYLQLLGLSQLTNPSSFDIENRVWPRPADPNFQLSLGSAASRTIRDQFLVFPSLRPFARSGSAGPGNPANDTIYTIPAEYLNSPQRPQALYHIQVRYQVESGGEGGSLMLGSVQLRQNSERLLVDGVPLVRGTDYSIDYDLGRVVFSRPDTLFPRPRQVTVQYEENPLFAETPTSIFGGTAEFPFPNGQIAFTAISQTQKTTFNRPPLGFEPAASLVGGVTAQFNFDADPLTAAVSHLPFGSTDVPSRIAFAGEFAGSRPQPNSAGEAYIEAFEGEGGFRVSLNDLNWYYSSQPANGHGRLTEFGQSVLDLNRATTLAWQSNGVDAFGKAVRYSIEQIDPLTSLIGAGVSGPEQLLWMTLYPLSIGGLRDTTTNLFTWKINGAPTGRRWRSIRTQLGPSGSDLSHTEKLEFWAQIDVSAKRDKNPILVFDFGDISENTVAFGPDTMFIRRRDSASPTNGKFLDSTFVGKVLQGFDRLDSERDPFSRTFNAGVNDNGLSGDLVGALNVVAEGSSGRQVTTVGNFPTCRGGFRVVQVLGDASADCTVNNNHLDEEDLDGDGVLNLVSAERENEQLRRYVVNLADPARYTRVGKCSSAPATIIPSQPDSVCWVLFRIPFQNADDSLGSPLLRRTRALRVTVISGGGLHDDEFGRIAIARLRLTGSPWIKRAENALNGIAGEETASGSVQAGTIGTQDRNLTSGVSYESPPGVVDAPDKKSTFEAGRVQVNERSLRITASRVSQFQRAEAYFRFPEGERNFMAYKELRLWARGVRNGWGYTGELQFYVKIGRDANNFYMYRTALPGGDGTSAWLPQVHVNFQKLFDLRAEVQNAYLRKTKPNTCTGLDSVLVANTPLPPGSLGATRYAVCSDGYMIYTLDPNASPPNLASVQELSVGMIRVANGTGTRPISPSDTLELWVDDIRLGGVVDQAGFAGQIGLTVTASDFADVRMSLVSRDPNFRQLSEQPTYLNDNTLNITSAVHLEKLLPRGLGIAIPVTINHASTSIDPLYVSQSDVAADVVQGLRKPRSSATSLTMSLRRSTPMAGGWYATLLNNLALNSSYTAASARSEYQSGQAHNFTLGLDYDLSRVLLPNGFSWAPLDLHLTSVLLQSSDDRVSFLKLAPSPDDTSRTVTSLTRSWRNGGSFVLRPSQSASLRWDISSVRDLRNYGSQSPLGVITATDRGEDRLLGRDAGIERERKMQGGLNFTPNFSSWIKPRLDFGTSYNMLRDPNAPSFLRENDSTGAFRLPRRMGSTQTAAAGLTLDVPRALRENLDTAALLRHWLSGFQPIDITLNRSLLSVFEATPVRAPIAYQLALGGTNLFRQIAGNDATSAGVVTQLALNHSIDFPLGAVVTNRYQRINTRNWTQRYDTPSEIFDGTQVMFPDLSLRWTMRPQTLNSVVSSISSSARYYVTRQFNTAQPTFFGDSLLALNERDQGSSFIQGYPINTTIVWRGARPFTTTMGYALSRRKEKRPGSSSNGTTADWNAEMTKAFRLPAGWNLPGDLRTRLGYQSTQGDNFISNPLVLGLRSRLSDNGRHALSFSTDTDVAENLSSSLVLSRVVSFDRNLNRHFTQTVLSAVMHLQFYAGDLK